MESKYSPGRDHAVGAILQEVSYIRRLGVYMGPN